jgi:hypothetical protein
MFPARQKPVTAFSSLSDIEQLGRRNGHFETVQQRLLNQQSRNLSMACGKAIYGTRGAR